MHLSGKTINLIAGDYTATIVTVGGAIAGLKYRGHDITLPFNPESVPVAHQGKILAPWPNRITDGKYCFAGHKYQLPLTDVKTMSASHGLVAWKEWVITLAFSVGDVIVGVITNLWNMPDHSEEELKAYKQMKKEKVRRYYSQFITEEQWNDKNLMKNDAEINETVHVEIEDDGKTESEDHKMNEDNIQNVEESIAN